MSATTSAVKTSSFQQRLSTLRDFRIIPRVETYPAVVAFVQTLSGKLIVLTLFAVGERFFLSDTSSVLELTAFLAIITFMPEYRRVVLAAAPLIFFVGSSLREPQLIWITFAVIGTGMLLYLCAMRWPDSLFGRRPLVFLLSGFSALIALASAAHQHTPIYSILWTAVSVMASYVWFIAYALTDRSSKPARDSTLELATFRPLWGSTSTPFPKGAAYLRRIEAQNPEQLAITQLKGLKLLAWAIMLAVFQQWWLKFFHVYLKIPSPVEALAMSVRGTPAPWLVRWESQILFFFEITLNFAVIGHRFISVCRLAGFNALRNSCRPLSSTTISEFFNRFYYYFKELLVDFFFYPTFLRYFKRHRRLRTFFATFVAIAFGNSFYHLARDWQFIQRDGLWKALVGYQVLFFYNVLMAAAIGVSQLRKRGPKPSSVFRRRIVQPAGVLFFYCILGVFGDESRSYTLGVHLRYLLSLFGVHS